MYSIQAAKNHAIQLKSMYLDWTRNICYIMLKVYYLGAGMLSDMREFNDVQGLSWTTRELVNSIKVVPFTSSVLVSISISLRFDPSRKCVWLALEFMDGGPSLGVVSSSSFDWVGLGLGGVDANNKHICFPSRDLEIPFFSTKEKREKNETAVMNSVRRNCWNGLLFCTHWMKTVVHGMKRRKTAGMELIRHHILVYCMELRWGQPCSDSVAPC